MGTPLTVPNLTVIPAKAGAVTITVTVTITVIPAKAGTQARNARALR